MMYLKIALSNLEIAKELYKKSKEREYLSDANFNMACYNAQQSLEYFIKFVINYNGEDFVPKHALEPNVEIFKKVEEEEAINKLMSIESLFSTINQWSTGSRYSDNFMATASTLDQVISICEYFSSRYSKLLDIKKDTEKNLQVLESSQEFTCLNCKHYDECWKLSTKDSNKCISNNMSDFES